MELIVFYTGCNYLNNVWPLYVRHDKGKVLTTYTVEELSRNGAPHAFALLLQHIRGGEEPFVTYGSIARFLEEKLDIPRVFATHVGAVAGHLMNVIHEIEPEAPLINALITRPSGLPGSGFGGFYNEFRRKAGQRSWSHLSRERQLEVVEDIRSEVRGFEAWDALYDRLYGNLPPTVAKPKRFTEKDGKPPETARRPGAGESDEHKALKKWACENPTALGLAAAMKGIPEASLLSGDRIDVLFTDGTSFVAVEVKSVHSGHDDWQRGIYQCVKYKAVLAAQEEPVKPHVKSILLTEEELPEDLKVRARLLGITVKVHALQASKTTTA